MKKIYFKSIECSAKQSAIAVVSAWMCLSSGLAQATLINDTVGCSINAPFSLACDLGSTVVMAGPSEFTISLSGTDQFDVNIEASSITITGIMPTSRIISAGGKILRLSSLDWVGMPLGEITGFSLDPASTLPSGFGVDDVVAGPHTINAIGGNEVINWIRGQTVIINLQTSHAAPSNTFYAWLGLSLVGVTLSYRQRKQGK